MKYLKCLVDWENRPRDTDIALPDNRGIGFLLFVANRFFFFSNVFSPLTVLRLLFCSWEWGRWLITRRFFIELYVLLWLGIEITTLLLINPSLQPNYRILSFVLWRLFDIVQSMYRLSFIGNNPQVIPARSLILIIFNYAEMIMIYAAIYIIFQSHYQPSFITILESLEYSFRVFIPFIGIDGHYSPIAFVGKAILYSEIVFSLFIHILIIQRVLAVFRH
jgi:hypothetical protein